MDTGDPSTGSPLRRGVPPPPPPAPSTAGWYPNPEGSGQRCWDGSAWTDYYALADIPWSEYDFMDFGAASGDSLRFCQRRFGAHRGLGIDINREKVAAARERGLDAVQADARALGVTDVVRFVAAMDFFEHLPDLEAVERVLGAAAEAATDFIFIKHPSFENEEYLKANGLIQYWHDWRVHPSHVQISDYCGMFERLGLHQYAIRYLGRIENSSDASCLPLAGPTRDQHQYDADAHGPKPHVEFTCPIWRNQLIFVALRPFAAQEWKEIVTVDPGTLAGQATIRANPRTIGALGGSIITRLRALEARRRSRRVSNL